MKCDVSVETAAAGKDDLSVRRWFAPSGEILEDLCRSSRSIWSVLVNITSADSLQAASTWWALCCVVVCEQFVSWSFHALP